MVYQIIDGFKAVYRKVGKAHLVDFSGKGAAFTVHHPSAEEAIAAVKDLKKYIKLIEAYAKAKEVSNDE